MRLLLSLIFALLATSAHACGPDTDCIIGDRTYRISLPEGATEPVPALIWAHGYRGSAAGAMRNGSLRKMLHEAGIALIAAQGVNGTWDLPYGPRTFDSTGAAEFAYFDALIEDATARHPVDPERIVVSGFSAGGMMVWNLACSHPAKFDGFIPISGTFWLKPPHDCATPVRSLVHIHGTTDKTVPLEGRRIRETKQGQVAASLVTYERHGDFGAVERYEAGSLACETRRNAERLILDFCLFEGGHSFRTEFVRHGLARLGYISQP